MDQDKKEMRAVHERDLDNLLDKLSIKSDFYDGRIKCKFCRDIMTKDNIYSLISESGAVNFVCDKPDCIADFMTHIENRKPGE